jgi:hypothetical protein
MVYRLLVVAAALATASAKVARSNSAAVISGSLAGGEHRQAAAPRHEAFPYVFDAAPHVAANDTGGIRNRRAEKNLCSFTATCGPELNTKCCKTCKIQNIDYKLDVNTFLHTLSRGTRKNPKEEWEYCGVEQFKSWPADKDQTVGALQTPFEEAKCDGLPFFEPSNTHYSRTDLPLSRYEGSGDKEVLFVKHSYKEMHADTYFALEKLAKQFHEMAGPSGLKLLVTQGYTPMPTNQPSGDLHDKLYYEARELIVTIIYTSSCGNDCLVAADDESDASSAFNEYAVRTKGTNAPPACVMDGATRADMLKCLGSKTLQNQEFNYRILADMAFTHFDFVKHEVLPGTESTSPIDSVVMSMRDHHRACGATADIGFLLDGSGSVGKEGWKAQLDFVRDFTGAIQASKDTAHIAVATFAGPRYSHFADHYDHVVEIQEDKQCETDNDCPHDVMETEGQFGSREVCKLVAGTTTKKCHTLVPEHCPPGTLYEMGTKKFEGDLFSYGCICAQGETCVGPTWTEANQKGCRQGFFQLNQGDCGKFTDAQLKDGAMIEIGSISGVDHPECYNDRHFFTHNCDYENNACGCTEPDYKWDESHSSWTNFDFNTHETVEEIHDTLDKGTPADAELVCPVIGHGKPHETKTYEEFHARDNFCWADGASHLSMGLKHILIGNGEKDEEFGSGGHKGMFDPRNGARASHKYPRILIVLTDGKSNPHFEPDQWIEEIRNAGIEVFAVGMGDNPLNDLDDQERKDYKKELNMMASEPLDYHRFDVSGAGHLNGIIRHLTDGLCEKPAVFPPGGFEIDPQLDEGQSQNYQVSCDEMTSTVFVMVDTSKGQTRIFVSADVREPSQFNKGTNGVEDVSANKHKVVKFEGGRDLASKQNLYIGVTNGDAATAEFRIQVLLDVFTEGEKELEGGMVDGLKAGAVVYVPKLKNVASYGSLSDWEISVASSGSSVLNNKGFFEYKPNKGIVVTAAGAAEFKNTPYVTGTLELTAFNKKTGTANTQDPGCLNGYMQITFDYKFKTFKAQWGKDVYEVGNLLEYAEFDTLRLGGVRHRRADIPAIDGTVVETVSCTDCIRYEIESGNELGVFALSEGGVLTIADRTRLDADGDNGNFDIVVVAFNAENQKSDPGVHVKITVKNVEERPYMVGGTFSITQALEEGLDVNGEFNSPAKPVSIGDAVHDIEIMNPGRLPHTDLKCSRSKSVSDFTVEFHPTDRCLNPGGQGCFCRIKRASGLNTVSGTSASLEIKLSAIVNSRQIVQDTQSVTLQWREGTEVPEDDANDDPNNADDEACKDQGDDAPIKIGLTKIKCSEAKGQGFCIEDMQAAIDAGNSIAEDGDAADWQSQYNNFISRCPVACDAPCTKPDVVDGPCHLQEANGQVVCGGPGKGKCVKSNGDTGGFAVGTTSRCECVFPFNGDNCDVTQTNDPCKSKAAKAGQLTPCLNGGVCHPAKSFTNGAFAATWDNAVCICPYNKPTCFGGLSCETKVNEDCPSGTQSCLVRKKAVPAVCSADQPCVPAPDNFFCLPASLQNDKVLSEEEIKANELEASKTDEDVAPAEAEKKSKWWVALIVIFLLLVIGVVLFLMYKRKQTNDTLAKLQSSKGQSRSGTTNRAAAARAAPRAAAKPIQGNSNPMYGMGGMADANAATYGDVPSGAMASSGYQDVQVASVDNPMYGMGAGAQGGVYDAAAGGVYGGDSGVYDAAAGVYGGDSSMYDSASANVAGLGNGQAYMDIAPNTGGAAPAGQAYMDIAPNAGGVNPENQPYMDVAPNAAAGARQQRGKPKGGKSKGGKSKGGQRGAVAKPIANPAYGHGGGAGIYDQAQVTGSVYDTAAQGGVYGGDSGMYDSAAAGQVGVVYDTAQMQNITYDTAA